MVFGSQKYVLEAPRALLDQLTLEDHLITCGNLPREELLGDTINVIPGNARVPPAKEGRILVSYEGHAHWVFSPNECETWFVRGATS